MPDGGKRVPNTGKGDCMMLAIADALRRYAPEEKASGRSVPAFLATFYAKHFQEYEALWDGVKPGAKNKQDAGDWKGSFQDNIDGFKICGTWCCHLEFGTACSSSRAPPGHLCVGRRGEVIHSRGQGTRHLLVLR